jgi:flagellar M-ring protein FliF
VTLRPGKRLSDQNVLAITNLVASAVEGLTPEFVSVVDMQGNLLSRPKRTTLDGADNSDATLDYKRQIEKDLMAKVESTLGPLLGEGRFRVGMSVDCDLTTTEQTDELFDPTKSVMVTSQKSEDLAGGSQPGGGVPGTASNLPRPPVQTVSSGSGMSRRTENAAYQSSRTVRQVKTPRGTIKRISASVLVDQPSVWQGSGNRRKRVPVPLSPDKLKAVHDIVAGVIGLDAARGDQLVLESLPFESDMDTEVPASGSEQTTRNVKTFKDVLQDWRVLVGTGAAVLLAIAGAVLLFVRRTRAKALAKTDSIEMSEENALASAAEAPALPPGDSAEESHASLFQLAAGDQTLDKHRKDLVEVVAKDPVLAAGVLRGWLDEDGM